MKILYLLNNYGVGGAEKGLSHLIDSGFFAGSRLTVAALFRGSGILINELDKKKIPGGVHALMPQKEMTVPKLLIAFFRLRKLIKKLAPDMVICSLEQANILGRIAAKITGRCVVVSFEHSTFYSKRYYYPLLKLTFPLVDAVLYDSESTRKAMYSFFNTHKVPWLYTPLVSVAAHKEPHDYKTRVPFTILSAGRLAKVKNYAESIKAVKLLKDKGYDIMFKIAGTGGLEQELKAQVKETGLENNVVFLGYVRDWQKFCHDADIFLQTSTYEGLCIVAIEAMATGIPVVATNVGGIADYSEDGEDIFKIQGFKAENIADAIDKIAGDENLRAKIGENGKRTVLHKFSEKSTKITWQKIIKELEYS